MFWKIKEFLKDDSGAVTVESVVVLGGSVWMAMVLVGDIGSATISVTDRINERLDYTAIVAQIHDSYGTGTATSGGGTQTGTDTGIAGGGVTGAGDTGGTSGDSGNTGNTGGGNPGNDKDVGNAGENPNGKDGWGDGTKGRSR